VDAEQINDVAVLTSCYLISCIVTGYRVLGCQGFAAHFVRFLFNVDAFFAFDSIIFVFFFLLVPTLSLLILSHE